MYIKQVQSDIDKIISSRNILADDSFSVTK